MKNKLILSLIFSCISYASSFTINDKISTFSLPDQFDRMNTINSSITTIIVSFELHMNKKVHKFLAKKEADFLENNHAVFISNISFNPSIITKMFILPNMRDYKYPILIINDENNKKFIEKDDKLTIYKLKNGIVQEINYVSTTNELEKFF